MKNVFFLIIVLGFSITTVAQKRTITGVVSDNSGPLPGVSILIKGTAKGTETDFNGHYSIMANKGDVLQYSYIGMETVRKTVGDLSTIDVKMTVSDSYTLDEVVITAYGLKTEKKSLSYSVAKVSEETIARGKTKKGKSNKILQSGQITAAEWNDLDNWNFWRGLLKSPFSSHQEHWSFYTKNRVSVLVKDRFNNVLQNVIVSLKKDNEVIWTTKTDNFGKATLWINLFKDKKEKLSNYSLYVNNKRISKKVKKENLIILKNIKASDYYSDNIEIAFVVDATGSMSDELEFLKKDLQSVIKNVKSHGKNIEIATASVFYRDTDDDYVVKKSGFTKKLKTTIEFINKQSADGGGDFPEAVHIALNTTINELKWSENAKTRIAFLLLDAPPHYDDQILNQIHNTITIAAKKGIKIIPITASGIDKSTEFLMRFMAISTNGTYVFITNDSGIGNNHIESSTGDYKVEILKDLLIRLISKYSKS